MTTTTSLAAWFVYILVIVAGQAQGSSCPAGEINCRTGNECVNHQYVCNRNNHCSDGSDEDPLICSVWKHDSRCNSGQYYCSRPSNPGCQSLQDFCDSGCPGQERICEIINFKRLVIQSEEDTGLMLTEQLVSLVQQAVNATAKSPTPCPMFYNKVGDSCLSFFSPAKISWPEARQFCLSLGGELLSIKKVTVLEQVLDYMRDSHFTSDYWIGGRFDMDSNAWTWVHDDSTMPLGSPYWAVRYNSSCSFRSPPHTDPYSSPSAGIPGTACYKYLQSPWNRDAGWCASLTYEHYYYITDDICQNKRSPVCSYNGNFHQKLKVTGP